MVSYVVLGHPTLTKSGKGPPGVQKIERQRDLARPDRLVDSVQSTFHENCKWGGHDEEALQLSMRRE